MTAPYPDICAYDAARLWYLDGLFGMPAVILTCHAHRVVGLDCTKNDHVALRNDLEQITDAVHLTPPFVSWRTDRGEFSDYVRRSLHRQ